MRAVGRFRSMILSCAWLGVALSSSLGVVSAQEAWQTSWPGFVSRLAQILSSCRVPTEAELNNRFREKITFTNSATITIGAVAAVGSNGIQNGVTFANTGCGALINIVADAIILNVATTLSPCRLFSGGCLG